MDLLERLELEQPIFQAGMAGGLATAELAAAVSNAGGMGTLGLVAPEQLAVELDKVRRLAPGRPIAVNLLLPFTRWAHLELCIRHRVTAVVLFYGFAKHWVRRLHGTGIVVLHQVGTVAEARRALLEGADALVAQGLEAGGHLLGTRPGRELLPEILAIAGDKPVLVSGGVAGPGEVRAALASGASGVLCGSRFLLTEECRAHPGYKRRVLGAAETVETRLFGFGWPARHRVVPNAATRRWCGPDGAAPPNVDRFNRLTGRLGRMVPLGKGGALTALQRLSIPLYSPQSALEGSDERLLDVTPLYAGSCVAAIDRIVPAAQVVKELATGRERQSAPIPLG